MSFNSYLIVGSGAREYAIAKRLKKEGCRVVGVFNSPNCFLEKITDKTYFVEQVLADNLTALAETESLDCIIIQEEQLLFEGLVDQLRSRGMPVRGSSQKLANVERFKSIGKEAFLRGII